MKVDICFYKLDDFGFQRLDATIKKTMKIGSSHLHMWWYRWHRTAPNKNNITLWLFNIAMV